MAFKFKWIEMGIAAALAAVIIFSYPILEREFNRNEPIEAFFEVKQLEVTPITPVGTFPTIVFDRSVNQDFKADWFFEIQTVEGDKFDTYCKAKGHKDYVKDEVLNNQGESIKWFTDRFPDCVKIKDEVGKYRIVVDWYIDRGYSYYDYKLEKISNVFEIVDPEAFIPSKTQESLNKTGREEPNMEAAEMSPPVSGDLDE